MKMRIEKWIRRRFGVYSEVISLLSEGKCAPIRMDFGLFTKKIRKIDVKIADFGR